MAPKARGSVVLLGTVALTLVLLDIKGGMVPDALRSAGATALGPLQTVSGAIAAPVVGWIEESSNFADSQERARSWAEQAPEAAKVRGEQRVADLDRLLGLVDTASLTVVPGRVVAYPATTLDLSNVVVDVGSADKVEPDMSVVSGAGLIGRTTGVTSGTSDVKLLSAPDSTVGGRILRTGKAVVVTGTGDPNVLSVRVLDAAADVQVGDVIVTFGSKGGRPFSADLPIGTIKAIDSDGAGGRIIRLVPSADLAALDLVGVVLSAASDAPRGTIGGAPQEGATAVAPEVAGSVPEGAPVVPEVAPAAPVAVPQAPSGGGQ